jgi:HSP20 family molecular chaperone IbpA
LARAQASSSSRPKAVTAQEARAAGKGGRKFALRREETAGARGEVMNQKSAGKKRKQAGRLPSSEAESLHAISFDFAESGDEMILRAELPDVSVEQHDVVIEPHAVRITSKARGEESGKIRRGMRSAGGWREIPQVLDLPIEVNPAVTTATLACGMLELRMPR